MLTSKKLKTTLLSLLTIIAIAGLFFYLSGQQTAVAAWWNEDWHFRRAVTVTNNAAAETDVYINLTISTATSTSFQADCGDLRFTNLGGQLLPYFIVSGCGTSNTLIHVNFETFPAGQQTIYYYYGNPATPDGFSATDFRAQAVNYTIGSQAAEEKGPGPVGYWSFDEGYGTVAHDGSPERNDGTITGASWNSESECVIGKCLFFDGVNDSVGLATSTPTVNTISFWIRSTTTSGQIIDLDGGSHKISISNGIVTATGFTSYYVDGRISSTISANDWHHIVAVTDTAFSASANMSVGKISSVYFPGQIDEIRLYAYARTAEQIQQDYNAGLAGMAANDNTGVAIGGQSEKWLTDGLVGYWNFDESSTSSGALDSSHYGNNGSYAGNASTSPGRVGRSSVFDGSGDYVNVPDSDSLNPESITLAAWVKTATTGQYIIAKDPPASIDMQPRGAREIRKIDEKNFEYEHDKDTRVRIMENEGSLPVLNLEKWGGEASLSIKVKEKGKKGKLDFLKRLLGLGAAKLTKKEGKERLTYGKGGVNLDLYPASRDDLLTEKQKGSKRLRSQRDSMSLEELRYISRGQISGTEISASYEIFDHMPADKPLIRSCVAENGIYFFGYRGVSQELRDPDELDLPVFRLRTGDDFECPLILVNGESIIIDFYLPAIKEEAGKYYAAFDAALKAALRPYGLDDRIRRDDHLLFYVDGITPKRVGRVAVDDDHLAAFLYIDRPDPSQISERYKPNALIRDTFLTSLRGLKDLDGRIDTSIKEEIVKSFAQQIGSGLSAQDWTDAEKAKIVELSAYLATDEWNKGDKGSILNQKRDEKNADSRKDKDFFEFELSLDEKPDSNQIVLEIETKDLDLFYQGELTQEEKDSGVYRPDNVIGSYAVYHRAKKGDYSASGGNDYATGKAFHIYRPKVVDSRGREVWGKLHYDEASKTLTNTIPQEFLDEAEYPIRHATGLTIGFEGLGASWQEGGIAGSQFSFSAGSIASIKMAVGEDSADGKTMAGIYRVSDSSLVANSEHSAGSPLVSSWSTFSYSVNPVLSDEDYVLVAGLNHIKKVSYMKIRFDTGDWSTQGRATSTYVEGTLPSSMSSFSTQNRKYSIYAVYTEDLKSGEVPYALSTVNGGQFMIKSNDIEYAVNASTGIDDNNWHHLAGTFDGQSMKLYIDGNLENLNQAYSGNLPLIEGDLRIGADYQTVPSHFFTGWIDDARLYDRALDPVEIRKLYEWAPGPVGHWKFDEKTGNTAFDNSGNGHNGTLTNGPVWSPLGKYGSALDFDGINDFVRVGTSSSFDITGNLTLEAWINPDTLTQSVNPEIICKGTGAVYYRMRFLDGGTLSFNTYTPADWTLESNSAVSARNWTHVAMTYDGSTKKIYLNGKLDAAVAKTGVMNSAADQYLDIGAYNSLERFDGKIDDVRIYNYARSQKQILEDMNAGAPASKQPILDLSFDEGYGSTAYDASGNNNNGTLYASTSGANTSATAMWSKEGRFGGALEFDGTNDFVEVPLNYAFSDYTQSVWIKTGVSAPNYILIHANYGNDISSSKRLKVTATSYKVEVDDYTPSGGTLVGNKVINDNQWHNIVSVREGNARKIYIDGKLDAAEENAEVYSGLAPNVLLVGVDKRQTIFSNPFSGLIDEVKMYDYALSPEEIKTLFNGGSAMSLGGEKRTANNNGTTVSGDAAEYCVPGDTAKCDKPVLEYKFDEKTGTVAYDSSGNGNDGTLTGGPVWGRGKRGGGLTFDGVDDYVVNNSPLNIPAMNSAITISAWAKSNQASPAHNTIVDLYNGALSDNITLKTISWGSRALFSVAKYGDTALVTTAVEYEFSANDWFYYTYTYDGSTHRLYRNGRLEGTGVVAPDVGTPSQVNIGRRGVGDPRRWGGQIDEVRIYNYARTPAQIAWDYNRGKPIAHWSLDEGEGLTAHNEIINSIHGTLTNMDAATDWIVGKKGKGLDFDGVDDYVEIGDYDILNQISVSAWFKRDSSNHYDPIISKYAAATNNRSYALWVAADNILNFTVSDNGQSGVGYISVVTSRVNPVSTGIWHHAVGTFHGDGNIKVYFDGELSGSVYDSSVTSIYDSSRSVRIGNLESGERYMDGQIDEVKIYNYALTAEQVRMDYNDGAVNFR